MRHVEPARTPTATTPHTGERSPMTDLTEVDEFNLLLDDRWDIDPPDEANDDPEAVLTRLRASLLAAVPRVDVELANGRALSSALVASDPSIEPALEPVQLFQGSYERGCDIGSRLAVQTLCLDQPGTSGGIAEGALQVPSGLGVVVGALPTGSVIASNRQPSESDVVHDHIQLGQHQIFAVAYVGVRLARHVKDAGTTEGGETVGGSSCGGELSACRRPSEMISDRRRTPIARFSSSPSVRTWLPSAQA
jgi:hypothetical protein